MSIPSSQQVYSLYPPFQPAPSHNVNDQPPTDQPAPSESPSQNEALADKTVVPRMREKTDDLLANSFLAGVGILLVFLTAFTPMWNAYRLMGSSSFVFFLGRNECFIIIVVCLSIVCFFSLVALLLQKFGHVADQTLMYLLTSSITVLGLFLLFMSMPLHDGAKAVTDELTYTCDTGIHTQQLYAYYNVLLQLRQQPGCKNLTSIEQCAGYQEQLPYTAFLKDMETNYECSGFCYTSNSTNVTNIAASASLLQLDFPYMDTKSDVVGLLQGRVDQFTVQAKGVGDSEEAGIVVLTKYAGTSKSKEKNKGIHTELVSLLTASANHSLPAVVSALEPWNQVTQGFGNTIQNMEATGWMDMYPPTLFTDANYKVTCDGAVVRELYFGVGDVSSLLYLEGSVLLCLSVLVGFMKLAEMCQWSHDYDTPMAADEASQYHAFVKPAMYKRAVL